jgi:hypothetical protein
MRLRELVTAERLNVLDASEDERNLHSGVTVNIWFDLTVWRDLPVLVQIDLDHGIFHVCVRYDINLTQRTTEG